ncbi:hypothetical protein [Paenibacillus sp. sgz500958]|uniref:hypothetical protein n=1 Tax=Paenibacillus sp. sgz500958 TaxID=3242475 RepID=UPI0036D29A29
MKKLGYLIMILGFITWVAGIKLQTTNHGQFEKDVILIGQIVFILGGIAQMIIRVRYKK